MRLDPSMTAADIEPILRHQAELLYGTDRAQQLADRIVHLARMMAIIGSHDLSIRGVPPDTTGITDWKDA